MSTLNEKNFLLFYYSHFLFFTEILSAGRSRLFVSIILVILVLADLNAGWNIGSSFRMGIGGSYKGKIGWGLLIFLYTLILNICGEASQAYVFIQPGYGLYKSDPIYVYATNIYQAVYFKSE
jgi:hypothetical protein